MKMVMLRGLALALVLHGLASSATASIAPTPAVPEIGPGAISAGVAILAGGVLLLRARRRK